MSGTHNRTVIQGFYGTGQEDTSRTEPFTYDVDHPTVLVGGGHAPALVEQSRRRSAVWDVISNGTDVVIDVSTS